MVRLLSFPEPRITLLSLPANALSNSPRLPPLNERRHPPTDPEPRLDLHAELDALGCLPAVPVDLA